MSSRAYAVVPAAELEGLTRDAAYGRRRVDHQRRSAAGQQQRQRQATEAALAVDSSIGRIRDRGVAMQRKLKCDAEIAELRVKLGHARRDAAVNGRYLPPANYRDLERRLEKLRNESQALQTILGKLKQPNLNHYIVQAVKRRLSREEFAELLTEAKHESDAEIDCALAAE